MCNDVSKSVVLAVKSIHSTAPLVDRWKIAVPHLADDHPVWKPTIHMNTKHGVQTNAMWDVVPCCANSLNAVYPMQRSYMHLLRIVFSQFLPIAF